MEVILLVLGMGFLILMEAPTLLKSKRYKDLAVFLIFISIGFTFALAQVIGFEIPSPSKGIETVVKSFIDIKFSFE